MPIKQSVFGARFSQILLVCLWQSTFYEPDFEFQQMEENFCIIHYEILIRKFINFSPHKQELLYFINH